MKKNLLIIVLILFMATQSSWSQKTSVFDTLQIRLPISIYNSTVESLSATANPFQINEEFRKNKIGFIYFNRSLSDRNYVTVPIQNLKFISIQQFNDTYQKMRFEMRLRETLLKIPDLSGVNFKKLGTEFQTGH